MAQLKQGAEDATNTSIKLDGNNCVKSSGAREGKGFEEIQQRFNSLVGSDLVYGVRFGESGEGFYSHFDPDKRTAVILRGDVDRFQYSTGGWLACNLMGGSGSAVMSMGGLIAHELIGHGPGAGELSARRIENQYHKARRQPQRCEGGP